MISDWDFLYEKTYTGKMIFSVEDQIHLQAPNSAMVKGMCCLWECGPWWLDSSASALLLVSRTPLAHLILLLSDKEIGSAFSLCGGTQCVAKKVLQVFVSLLVCVWVIAKAGSGGEQWE